MMCTLVYAKVLVVDTVLAQRHTQSGHSPLVLSIAAEVTRLTGGAVDGMSAALLAMRVLTRCAGSLRQRSASTIVVQSTQALLRFWNEVTAHLGTHGMSAVLRTASRSGTCPGKLRRTSNNATITSGTRPLLAAVHLCALLHACSGASALEWRLHMAQIAVARART